MNKTAKSFVIVTGFSVLTRLISFLFKIWMSRSLGAQVVGLYQIALSVMLMLFTITAGAPTVLSRKVAECNSSGNLKRQNSLTTASIIMGVVLSVSLCGIFYGIGGKLDFIFTDDRCLPIFFIMLPTLITSTLYASFRSWFWGRKRFLAFSSTELVDEVAKIIFAMIFAGGCVAGMDSAQGIALAMTLADVVSVLVLAILFFCAGGRFAKPKGFLELASGTIPLSATRIITSLTASLTALIIPQMLVNSGMSTALATAEYGRVAGMALPLIMAPITFVSALAVVLIPDIAQLKAQGEFESVKTKLSTQITFSVLIASVFFVFFLPLGEPACVLLYNDARAGEYVSYCSILLYPIALAQATTPMLNSLGKEKQTLLHTLLGSLLVLPCIFLLPKYIGSYAMAVGSAGCFLLIAILNFVTLKREVGTFMQMKKSVQTVAFSLPLAVLGLLCKRLLYKFAGTIGTILAVGVILALFLFVFVQAFDIVDIAGCYKLFKPTFVQRKKQK